MRKMNFLKKPLLFLNPRFSCFQKRRLTVREKNHRGSSFERCKNRGFKRGRHYIGTIYLNNNDLILSKIEVPHKIAVAAVKEGQQILASGNLYIIEIDEKKADPYYLRAFFESERGSAILKSITHGVAIQTIAADDLKNIRIPLLPMEEQKRIARKYCAEMDEIAILKREIARTEERLHGVFDEECEE